MNATQEEWRPVVGWETLYEVSDHGRIRSLERTVKNRTYPAMLRRLQTNPDGYKLISFTARPHAVMCKVHSVVLCAFVGPRPEGMVACHNDGNPANNHISNLRWDTHAANAQDSIRHGTCARHGWTHCQNGHEYTTATTHFTIHGTRECRPCRAKKRREANARRRAARASEPSERR